MFNNKLVECLEYITVTYGRFWLKKKKKLAVCNTGVPPKGVGKQILKATGTTLVYILPRWKGTDSSTWSQCITTNKTVAVFSSWQHTKLQKMLTPRKHDSWTMRPNSSMGNAQVQIHNQWLAFVTIHEILCYNNLLFPRKPA